MRRTILAAVSVALAAVLASPATATSDDPYSSRQWGLQKIQAEDAWGTSDGEGAVVAVVDTGVDIEHPDLEPNIVAYPEADFVEPSGNCAGSVKKGDRACAQDGAQDEEGHGTHVAGIIGAVADNGIGVAGVAPSATLLPVRVLDESGEGPAEDIAAGIRFATERGADVINLSLGYMSGEGEALQILGQTDVLYDAIDRAWSEGAVIVVAAGNDTVPLCAEPASALNVLCIGATDQRDLLAPYSNTDIASLDTYMVAPGGTTLGQTAIGPNSPTAATCGEDIFSTYLRTESPFCSPEPGYEALGGTSMAAAHVSGVAALLAGDELGLTNDEIVECLTATTDDLGAPGRDPVFGFGRLNALNAVSSCGAK